MELLPFAFNHEVFSRIGSKYPMEGPPTWASYFTTWDTANYLNIAKAGYEPGSPFCAFYPMWPGLIWLGCQPFGGGQFYVGLVLANLFSVIALYRFYSLTISMYDQQTAWVALLLLLSAPGSLFLNFPYTEPLFLLLSILLFEFLNQRKIGRAAIVGLLMPAIKAVGVFAIIPLALEVVRSREWKRSWMVTFPAVGYCFYFAIMYAFTGNLFEGFEAQKNFPAKPSIASIFKLDELALSFIGASEIHDMRDSLIDRLHFALFLACLPLVYRMGWGWFTFVLFLGVVPAFSSKTWTGTAYDHATGRAQADLQSKIL